MKRFLVDGKDGYEIRQEDGHIESISFLVQGENDHFLLFYQPCWPCLDWGRKKFTGKVAHTREEGLDKAHSYVLEELKKRQLENTGYEFEDMTSRAKQSQLELNAQTLPK